MALAVPLLVAMDLPDGCGGPAVPDTWKEPAIEKERNYGSEFCRNIEQRLNQPLLGSDMDQRRKDLKAHRENC